MEEGRREYFVYILPAPSWPLGTTGSPQSEMEEPGEGRRWPLGFLPRPGSVPCRELAGRRSGLGFYW